MSIQPLTLSDLQSMYDIEQATQLVPWSKLMLLHSLQNNHYCYGVKQDNQLIAFAVVSFVVNEAELLNIAVDPGCQNQGYGNKLLEHLFDQAKQQQVKQFFLEVHEKNTQAIRFYERLGFKQIGRRKNYYPTGDALVYQINS